MQKPINIGGIIIPSHAPAFLVFVGIHVLVAFTCVVAGAVAMLSKKRPGRHPKAGTIYYWCLSVVFISATILSIIRWTEDYPLFIFGLLALSSATLGRTARGRRWRQWVRIHIAGMGTSYIFLLIAFYVDNGKNLPIWRDMPPVLYWLLPAVVGIVLVIRALLWHPLIRKPELEMP